MSTLASFTFTPIDRSGTIDVRIEFGGYFVYNYEANTGDEETAVNYAIEFVANTSHSLLDFALAGRLAP